MKSKLNLFFVLVIGVGLYFYFDYKSNKAIDKIYMAYGNKQRIFIAKKDIAEGSVIKSEDLEQGWILASFVAPNAIRDANKLIGKIAKDEIKRGEQMLSHRCINGSESE